MITTINTNINDNCNNNIIVIVVIIFHKYKVKYSYTFNSDSWWVHLEGHVAGIKISIQSFAELNKKER